ncbi:LPS translocon maturation chaperone LptM [Teredinibacter purpureus]|uniref:LPS translocon maturation chaperone LptM n=1 Tax=Teredinibacter purpureus TaxID=2731756 RepID=UPI0005F856A0|nr:lipoprotein [Teredinibacter purpureus]
MPFTTVKNTACATLTIRRATALGLMFFGLVGLSACGQKGPLKLPDPTHTTESVTPTEMPAVEPRQP